MSLDELSQNPVLDDTIRSYYNNPVQVAQVGSYYVFQSDGRHRTLAAQSLDTYIPVLVTGSYNRDYWENGNYTFSRNENPATLEMINK